MYADIATEQQPGTFLRLHEAAFEVLVGSPKRSSSDCIKPVGLGADERGEVR